VADDLNEAVTEFHAVQTFKDKLVAEGFTQLKEIDAWHLEAGKSYFFTRNHSTFVAFRVGK
jgi:aspartyl aminopeptidase